MTSSNDVTSMNKKNDLSLSLFVLENMVLRDGFGRPIPLTLHTITLSIGRDSYI